MTEEKEKQKEELFRASWNNAAIIANSFHRLFAITALGVTLMVIGSFADMSWLFRLPVIGMGLVSLIINARK